jgi:hypothetical protein
MAFNTEYNDYILQMMDFTEEYAKLCLTNFDYYVTVIGTRIRVVRANDEDPMKKALGNAFVFDGTSVDSPATIFETELIFNRSAMYPRFRGTSQDLEAYTNKDVFMIGDQIEFESRGFFYKYKVEEIDRFDPNSRIELFKLTLTGFEEVIIK